MKQCLQCHKEYPDNVKYCPQCGAPVRAVGEETDPLVGRLLGGRYMVEERVGAGGFGTVYKVRDQRFGNAQMALKVIHPRHAHDRIAMERFRQEAHLLFDLGKRSAAIVQFYNFEEDEREKLFYFAMEWVDGIPLTQLLVLEGKLSPQRAVRLVRQVCEPLRVAHRRGVIHRDLKPDNLMLVQEEDEEMVKVLDFGIAKALAEQWGEKRFTESVLGMPGTAGYAAPEQLEGRTKEIGAPTDLFALGVILYNLLTGRDPWFGKPLTEPLTRREEMVELPSRVLEGRAISPRQWNPELPEEVEAIIFKLMEKDPNRRFQSAKELDQALAALEQKWTAPPPPPIRERLETRPPPPPPPIRERLETRPTPPPRPWYQRPRVYGLGLVGVGLILALLVGIPNLIWPDPTVSLQVDPTVIKKGESTTLTWETSNATSVRFEPSLGTVGLSGSRSVEPEETTTYKLIASGEGGTTEQSVQVEVQLVSAPVVNLKANPTVIRQGETTTLTWETTNATRVQFQPSLGTVELNGSRSLKPRETTTYTLIATGEGGRQTEETVRVEVQPGATPPPPSRPEVKNLRVAVNTNVSRSGRPGLEVQLSFLIQGARNTPSCAAAYFYDSSGNLLRDVNGEFRDRNGHVAVFRDFTPRANSSPYNNLGLFLPVEELHLRSGSEYRLQTQVKIWPSGCGESTANLATSRLRPFNVQVGPVQVEARLTNLRLRIDSGAVSSGETGIKVHFSFVVTGHRGSALCAAVHLYDENRKPVRDTNNQYGDAKGNVAVFLDFTPPRDRESYSDMTLFIPVSELHLARGKYNLHAIGRIWQSACTDRGQDLGVTDFQPFDVVVR